MYLIEVSPFKKIKGFKKLSYFSNTPFEKGDIIKVPFRNSDLLAIVTDKNELDKVKLDIKNENFTPRKIEFQKPLNKFLPELIDSSFFCGEYFVKEVGPILSAILPKAIIDNLNELPEFAIQKSVENKQTQEFERIREKILTAFEKERYEHYKALVRQELAMKKSSLIIAPNLRVAQNIYKYISSGITQMVKLVDHQKKQELLKQFKDAQNTEPACFVGTYKSLALPIKNLNLIIVDSYGSASYRLLKYPKIDIRVFAKKLAEYLKIDIVFADSFLPLEEYLLNEKEENIAIDHVPKRVRKKTLIRIIDINKEVNYSKEYKLEYPIISREILGQISINILNGKKVFLYSPKKGLASQTVCNDCAYSISCPKCKANLRLIKDPKENENKFLCFRCGFALSSNILCPKCGSWRLFELGFGIDKYVNYLEKKLQNVEILSLDADSVKSQKEVNKILERFRQNQNSILIGTSKALLYLNENEVDYSAALNIDSIFAAPGFNVEEDVFANLIKILEKTSEKMDLQVKNTEHRVIKYFYKKNIKDFIKSELQLREKLMWPPFVRLVKITVKSDKKTVIKLMQEFLDEFHKYKPRIFKDFIYLDKNTVTLSALIRIPSELWPNEVEDFIHKLKMLSSNFEIEIDPEEI